MTSSFLMDVLSHISLIVICGMLSSGPEIVNNVNEKLPIIEVHIGVYNRIFA